MLRKIILFCKNAACQMSNSKIAHSETPKQAQTLDFSYTHVYHGVYTVYLHIEREQSKYTRQTLLQ